MIMIAKELKKWKKKMILQNKNNRLFVDDDDIKRRKPSVKLSIKNMNGLYCKVTVNDNKDVRDECNPKISKMMLFFINFDERVRPFLLTIKYWAKHRNIYDSYQGFLNPFGWMMLGVYYLQIGIETPILPVIKFDEESGNILNKKVDSKENKLTVSELLYGFYKYYSEFEWNKYSINIMKGEIIQRKLTEVDGKVIQNTKFNPTMMIHHPFSKFINIGKYVKSWCLMLMQKELKRGMNTMLNGTLDELFKFEAAITTGSLADEELNKNCLLLKNIRWDVTKNELTEWIKKIREPVSIIYNTTKTGKHTGKAFVVFKTVEDAHSVNAELGTTLLKGRRVYMTFVDINSNNIDVVNANTGNVDGLKPVYFNKKRVKVIGGNNNDKLKQKIKDKKLKDKILKDDIINEETVVVNDDSDFFMNDDDDSSDDDVMVKDSDNDINNDSNNDKETNFLNVLL